MPTVGAPGKLSEVAVPAIDWGATGEYEISAVLPYVVAGGADRFYGTRTINGQRAVIYPDFIGSVERNCHLLVGLGCGDSEIELSLVRAFPHPPAYWAVDVSADMLAMTQQAASAAAVAPRLMQDDFFQPSVRDALAEGLAASAPAIVTLLGRTFGNSDLQSTLPLLAGLAQHAHVYFDVYAAREGGGESFRARCEQIAISARPFFLGPLIARGFDCRDLTVRARTHVSDTMILGTFFVNFHANGVLSDAGELVLRLFTTRCFFVERLVAAVQSHGMRVILERDVPHQLLPMVLLGVTSSGGPFVQG